MRRYLPFFIAGAVGLLTLTGGALLYRAKRPPILAIPKNSTPPEKAGTESMHVRGDINAPVTLEEFGDFQCPPCGKLAGASEEIEEGYGDKLRIIFRHFPLAVHPHALEAALVSEAAGLQGHFWKMHDLLYQEQAVWSKAADARTLFNAYAEKLGLDVDRFKTDMDSLEVKERVASDRKRGVALGVTSTPTVFINDLAVAPPVNVASVRTAINVALKTKSVP